MKHLARCALAVVLVVGLANSAQALTIVQTNVYLSSHHASVRVGQRVTLTGAVTSPWSTGRHHCPRHHCPPPPPPPPHCRHHCPPPCRPHPHYSVTIYENGAAVATVPTDASGAFTYTYRADATATWSAMFHGWRWCHHPHRDVALASVSRTVTVSVTSGEAALLERRWLRLMAFRAF